MNNICVIDNALSNQDCDFLINNLKNNIQGSYGNPHNYNYCDLAFDENDIENFSKSMYEYAMRIPNASEILANMMEIDKRKQD